MGRDKPPPVDRKLSHGTMQKINFQKSYQRQGDLKEPEAEKLLDAINHEDQSQVSSLLANSREKIDRLKAININGGSFLHYAAAKKNVAIIEKIIEAGFPINQPTRRPMEIYIETYHTVSTFRTQSTPLYIAVVSGNKAIVNCLLQLGADPNIPDNDGNLPLHNAAWNNRLALITLLLTHRSILDAQDRSGSTPLRKAAYRGHLDAVTVLIDAGADVNKKTRKGRTALHCAALYGHTDVVAQILSVKSCIVDATDNDSITPLHAAVYGGKRLVASELIRAGASVHIQTKLGNTPLHLACMEKWFVIAHMLVQEGADQNAINRFHESPLDVLDAGSRKTILSVVNAPTIKELEQLEKEDHQDIITESVASPSATPGSYLPFKYAPILASASGGKN